MYSGSVCLCHATALELYDNFSFTEQLYPVYAPNGRSFKFPVSGTPMPRALSMALRFQRYKSPGFFVVLFSWGGEKRSHHQGPPFVSQAY